MDQQESLTYKQLGNAVNVSVIYNVLKAQVVRDLDLLKDVPTITKTILGSPNSPDEMLNQQSKVFGTGVSKKTTQKGAALKLADI